MEPNIDGLMTNRLIQWRDLDVRSRTRWVDLLDVLELRSRMRRQACADVRFGPEDNPGLLGWEQFIFPPVCSGGLIYVT